MTATLDDRIRRWAAGDDDIANQTEIANGIEALVRARIGSRLDENRRQDVIDLVQASFWKMVTDGLIPSERCRTSTAVYRIAEFKTRDVLRKAYTRPDWVVQAAGDGADLEMIAYGQRRENPGEDVVQKPVLRRRSEPVVVVECATVKRTSCKNRLINAWLNENAMTVREFALLLGFGHKTVERACNNRRPPSAQLARIISVTLNLDSEKIFGFQPVERRGGKRTRGCP